MRHSKLNYIIALFFIMLIPLTASAEDFHVTTNQELQTVLSTADRNGEDDTVFLAAGTYTGNFSYQADSNENQAFIIKAEDGLNPGQVVLDGGSNGRTLLLSAGTNVANFTIERLTLTNGDAGTGNGGGVAMNTAGNISIIECTLKNNRTSTYTYNNSYGGGAYLNGNDIILQNNIVTGNSTPTNNTDLGSGLYIAESNDLTIEGNVFSSNSSGRDAMVIKDISAGATIANNRFSYNDGRAAQINTTSAITLNIESNIIEHNTYSHESIFRITGGGQGHTCNISNNLIKNNSVSGDGSVSVWDFKNIAFTGNVVSDNSSTGDRGGVLARATSTLIFSANHISNNIASGHGGAGWLEGPTITITNNIITKNSAGTYAGGLYLGSSNTLHFTNNTVYDNTASGGAGGGIYTGAGGAGGIHFYNNIIWGNSASGQGDDLYLGGTGSADKNLKYNSIHDYAGTLFNFASNNIDVDPLFIDSTNDDYHLGAVSLCLDVGLNTAPGIPTTDLDGNARISNTTVDLGAYEHSTGDYHPADTNNDWVISSAEFTAYGNSWKTTASPINIDYVTRAGYLLQNGNPVGTYKNIGGGKPLCWVPKP